MLLFLPLPIIFRSHKSIFPPTGHGPSPHLPALTHTPINGVWIENSYFWSKPKRKKKTPILIHTFLCGAGEYFTCGRRRAYKIFK